MQQPSGFVSWAWPLSSSCRDCATVKLSTGSDHLRRRSASHTLLTSSKAGTCGMSPPHLPPQGNFV